MSDRFNLGPPPRLAYCDSMVDRAAHRRNEGAALEVDAIAYAVAGEHIVLKRGQDISDPVFTLAEARSLAEQIAREAKEEGADWNALAAQYTDEPGSKQTGGDLGKFGRGQMVKSFENAAFALKVGQISGVVASPFGFHVIHRYE